LNRSWKLYTIQDFISRGEAELKTGPFGTQLHASDYVKSGTPVINVRNIGFGDIKEEKLEFVSDETVNRLLSHLLVPNDIVFGRKGAVERHAFIKEKTAGWFQGSDCLRLRLKSPSADPRFVSYCLLTEDHQQWMKNQCSHAATMASLNQDIISRISLHLPSLPTQRKIAAILSAYDDLIENNTRRIKILEEMAQALYREWFVRFRFPGHEKVRMVDSPLGRIAEGWEVKKLFDVAEVTYGHPFKSRLFTEEPTGSPVIRIRDINNNKTETFTNEHVSKKYFVENGDIIVGMDGDFYAGKWAGGKAYLNQRVVRFRPKKGLSRYYLYLALMAPIALLDSTITGTTVAHLSDKDLRAINLTIPESSICKTAKDILDPIFDFEIKLNIKNSNLRRTRDLLLPKLISGELNVETLGIKIGNMNS